MQSRQIFPHLSKFGVYQAVRRSTAGPIIATQTPQRTPTADEMEATEQIRRDNVGKERALLHMIAVTPLPWRGMGTA